MEDPKFDELRDHAIVYWCKEVWKKLQANGLQENCIRSSKEKSIDGSV